MIIASHWVRVESNLFDAIIPIVLNLMKLPRNSPNKLIAHLFLQRFNMTQIPLIFSAKSKNIHRYENESNKYQLDFSRAQKKTFTRDNYICQCCHFYDKSNQLLHYCDDDFSNINLSNLVTICPLCCQTFRINDLSRRKQSTLIWLPELSQKNLNSLIRALLIVKYRKSTVFLAKQLNDTKNLENALNLVLQEFVTLFQYRLSKANTKIHTNDPFILARALLSLSHSEYEVREQYLAGLRILPSEVLTSTLYSATKNMVESWFKRNGSFRGLSPTTWPNLFKPILTPHFTTKLKSFK